LINWPLGFGGKIKVLERLRAGVFTAAGFERTRTLFCGKTKTPLQGLSAFQTVFSV
jgi:hypothetical protein